MIKDCLKIISQTNSEREEILKEKILGSGACFHFPPGSVHQEEALTNCKIIEASSPYFNDRVRVEKHYGVDNRTGLPSTKLSQIKLIDFYIDLWLNQTEKINSFNFLFKNIIRFFFFILFHI